MACAVDGLKAEHDCVLVRARRKRQGCELYGGCWRWVVRRKSVPQDRLAAVVEERSIKVGESLRRRKKEAQPDSWCRWQVTVYKSGLKLKKSE